MSYLDKTAFLQPESNSFLDKADPILITGSTGFIGPRVVNAFLERGYSQLRCVARKTSDLRELSEIVNSYKAPGVEIVTGDLLSREDCDRITKGMTVVCHLAAAMRETSHEKSYLHNVVPTQNLLHSAAQNGVRRFVNLSSLRVYSNFSLKRWAVLDERSQIETDLARRADAYCTAKVKQEKCVAAICRERGISYVTLRPGVVYGPGSLGIHRMIGKRIKLWGLNFFLHLGGPNLIPFTYVDNCAEAIVLAAIRIGINEEVYNVVDDDLPTSRSFLRQYEKNVANIRSIYIPYRLLYLFAYSLEQYSRFKKPDIAAKLNRKKCAAAWKGNRYSNTKLKQQLGWNPKVKISDGLLSCFDLQKNKLRR